MTVGCPYWPGCGCGTQSGPHACEWKEARLVKKQGTILIRIHEHFSSTGRVLSHEMLTGHCGVDQAYGVGMDRIIEGLSANDLGEGAEYEITARLVKTGKAGVNPFQKKRKTRALR